MTPLKRRQQLEQIFSTKRWAQFGQTHDTSTAGGATGCTHTVLQALIYLWAGESVTHDDISKVAGYWASSGASAGMNSSHVDRVIKHWKLPYVASWRVGKPSTAELIDIVRTKAPALVALRYGYYPLKKGLEGKVYANNGFAWQGGRNDMGFAGDHAICLFAVRYRSTNQSYHPRTMDPDHGSDARPKIPPFDVISERQLRVFWSQPLLAGYGQIAYLPTKEWTGVPT